MSEQDASQNKKKIREKKNFVCQTRPDEWEEILLWFE